MKNDGHTLVIFSRFLPSMGGIENFTNSLAHKLIDLGYSVSIITTDGKVGHTKIDGINVYRIKSYSILSGRYPIPNPFSVIRAMQFISNRYTHISVLINGRYYLLSFIGAKISNKMGIKPVLLDHSSSYIPSSNKIVARVFKAAEIVVTKILNTAQIDYYGISSLSSAWLNYLGIKSCGEINNAIDESSFISNRSSRKFIQENSNKLTIIYAGRLIEEKGVLTVAALASAFPNTIEVLIAGSGPLSAEIARIEKAVNNLHYLGRLNRADLASLLIQSDIFCFPSDYPEGMPTCLLEAAVCDCAVITTNNGGTREIIPDSSYGFIVSPRNQDDLNLLISRLISDPSSFKIRAEKLHAHVTETFTWSKTASKVLDACDKANPKKA